MLLSGVEPKAFRLLVRIASKALEKILLERVVNQGLLLGQLVQVTKRDRPKCVERVINNTRHEFPRSTGELIFSRVRDTSFQIDPIHVQYDIDIVTLSSFHAYLSKASSNDSSPAGGTLG